jgi:pullulanase
MMTLRKSRLHAVAGLLLLGLLFVPGLGPQTSSVLAAHTPNPTSVTIAGSMQSELGCPGDWQPECGVTHLTYDANDDVWQGSWNIPAGNYEYKAALNDSWDENYGLHAIPGGPNIPLSLTGTTSVKFYYDHKTHWITDNKTSTIAVAVGSFQSELGCSGDWAPDCLRSWLQDIDGDGVYTYTTSALPAGIYEAKVAINESWDENYGANCAPGGANISFSVPSDNAPVSFTYNSTTHCLDIGTPQRGTLAFAQAHWVTRDTIAWNLPTPGANTYRLYWDPSANLQLTPQGIVGGQYITLTYDPNGLPPSVLENYPHLTGFSAFRISQADLGLVPAILKSQIAIEALAPDGTLVDATSLQIPGVLDDLYTYNGSLGVLYSGATPTIKVWAPTAQNVLFHIYNDSNPNTQGTSYPMTYDPASGVWSITGDTSWTGKYYLFEVRVFTRATGHIENNLVTDPYSISLSMNSTRSQIINLEDPSLKPAGWDSLRKPPLAAPEDIAVYELHMRDFSAYDQTVPAQYRGKYLAFTQYGSNGMMHLRALAQAGLTHVHMLPAFDFATVNEDPTQRTDPDPNVLGQYPPDSPQQQAIVGQTRAVDSYNWGYDPYHYNTPEGSYATNPDGPTRIREFRAMVKSLGDNGLRLVMDVVYNHTNSAGQDPKSVLDKVVPGYYHRLNLQGQLETSTCCANTASEHSMMEKLMVDSTVMWAKEYKVDGFRFDLMGHHMKRNIERIQDALHSLTLAHDGVDGSKIYIYGEGWNFGEVADNARGVNATQINMAGTGVGTFNDRIRDGVRGGGPFSGLQEQGFIDGLYYDPNGTDQGPPAQQRDRLLHYSDWIRIGMAGNLKNYQLVDKDGHLVTGWQIDYNGQPAGYTLDPQEDINYAEAHDNETLFDAIAFKAPVTSTIQNRVRMQDLGMDIVGLGEGIPFFHAGVDMLRSKSLDRDSYDSGDWFNNLNFTYRTNNFGVGLPPAWSNQSNWPVMQPLLANPAIGPSQPDILQSVAHFREVLQIRKSSPLFRLRTESDIKDRVKFWNTGPNQLPALIVMSINDTQVSDLDPNYELVVVLVNANDEAQTFSDPAFRDINMTLDPVQASSSDPVVRSASFNGANGSFYVPARTTAVFVGGPPTIQPPNGGRRFTTTLTGAAEVPRGDPDGTGTAWLALNPGQGTVCYTLSVSGITLPATAAHIHIGAPGAAGPVVVPLTAPNILGVSSGCTNVSRDLVQQIIQDPQNYYVNVHNVDYPAGALRGQLHR